MKNIYRVSLVAALSLGLGGCFVTTGDQKPVIQTLSDVVVSVSPKSEPVVSKIQQGVLSLCKYRVEWDSVVDYVAAMGGPAGVAVSNGVETICNVLTSKRATRHAGPPTLRVRGKTVVIRAKRVASR